MKLLKVLLWIVVVAAVIFLALWLSSKIAGFASIRAMLQFIIRSMQGGFIVPLL